MCSSDEDEQTEAVAADSRITYAIAMNNRMAQDGSSNSGSGSGSGSAEVVNEPATTATAEQTTVVRYPRRTRRQVNYKELETPDDDHYICMYLIIFNPFKNAIPGHTYLGNIEPGVLGFG